MSLLQKSEFQITEPPHSAAGGDISASVIATRLRG